MTQFRDRYEAGKLLGERLLKYKSMKEALILTLPRGGVPVAVEISKVLNLEWDLLFVKKIGAPQQSEYAIGAVSEDKQPVWNLESISELRIPKKQLSELVKSVQQKIMNQINKWRAGQSSADVKNKTIILVDDGLATGLTMQAAVQVLKRRGVAKIVVAVPVGSLSAIELLKPDVYEVVCLYKPDPFYAVGEWYRDFSPVTDETVTYLMSRRTLLKPIDEEVFIPIDNIQLRGNLNVPKNSCGIVVFVHGSGSSRLSPRNKEVADTLNKYGFATLLFDLLSTKESKVRSNVFDIELLSARLLATTKWVHNNPKLTGLPVSYFGASTGAAAALKAAADNKNVVGVISRGGRPDLAMENLPQVKCPVLLIVGELDTEVMELNTKAMGCLRSCTLITIPGATHLFEEPGTLDLVTQAALKWLDKYARAELSEGLPRIQFPDLQ